MKWGLVIGSRAKRQLRKLTDSERHQIDVAFSELCHNPYHGDVHFSKVRMARYGAELATSASFMILSRSTKQF